MKGRGGGRIRRENGTHGGIANITGGSVNGEVLKWGRRFWARKWSNCKKSHARKNGGMVEKGGPTGPQKR